MPDLHPGLPNLRALSARFRLLGDTRGDILANSIASAAVVYFLPDPMAP